MTTTTTRRVHFGSPKLHRLAYSNDRSMIRYMQAVLIQDFTGAGNRGGSALIWSHPWFIFWSSQLHAQRDAQVEAGVTTCWNCPSTATGELVGDGETTTCPDCGEVREDQ
jgi:hypothetical protein